MGQQPIPPSVQFRALLSWLVVQDELTCHNYWLILSKFWAVQIMWMNEQLTLLVVVCHLIVAPNSDRFDAHCFAALQLILHQSSQRADNKRHVWAVQRINLHTTPSTEMKLDITVYMLHCTYTVVSLISHCLSVIFWFLYTTLRCSKCISKCFFFRTDLDS